MKKVIVAYSSNSIAARECTIGVFRYVNAGRKWELQILDGPDALTPDIVARAQASGVNGILTGMREETPGYRALVRAKLAVVLNNFPPAAPPPENGHLAVLHNDDQAIGRVGARYLRARGAFRSYAFVPTEGKTSWSTYRQRGFRLELASHGIVPASFHYGKQDLLAWLRALPKPAAVMAANDKLGVQVIECCRRLKLSVPGQVAVLGVDNDELFCNATSPTLSSVHPDHVELGRRAAEELDRLMNHRRGLSPAQLLVPPLRVVERDSTKAVPPAGHLIRAGLDFVRQNYAAGITARDVAEHLGVSESLLRLRFRDVHGRSLRDIICETRIDAAKRLLAGSSDSLAEIARKCGFSSACRLSHAFYRKTGLYPGPYRKSEAASISRRSAASQT